MNDLSKFISESEQNWLDKFLVDRVIDENGNVGNRKAMKNLNKRSRYAMKQDRKAFI